MSATQIQSLSHTHEAMMDWLIANPQLGLREMSAYFGYSVSWLSVVINSDAFKQKYAERRGELDSAVTMGIRERLQACAEIGLEKIAHVLEKSEDPKVLVDATDKILHRMGYAPNTAKAPGGDTNIQQNNIFVASPEDLAQARKVIGVPHSVPEIPALATVSNGAPFPETVTVEVADVSSSDASGI